MIIPSETNYMDKYFSGEKLYGDDFDLDEIKKWFDDEKEGYADLGAKEKKSYKYSYHALNAICGFDFINECSLNNVLGLGSAYGEELKPILNRAKHVTIVEPSESFVSKELFGVPCNYIPPNITGDMPFKDNQFDLITSFGVLHHIPNVSHVVTEMARCLSPGGRILIREPITSMGDWRNKRYGLTKHERGVSDNLFDKLIRRAGLEIDRKSYCMFPPLSVFIKKVGVLPYNSKIVVYMDLLLSRLLCFNYKYHAKNNIDKIRPTSVFYVLRKIN